MGVNAVHDAAEVLGRLGDYVPARPVVDGLEYREGLNAVGIRGGVAGNVIPDECIVTVNYRFAPDKTVVEAIEHVREVFKGYDVTVVDEAPAARPGLHRPAARDFVEAVGADPRPKFGWTDVARFAALGVPAGTAALLIDRLALGLDGLPVEWRLSRCLTANFHYHSDLT
jgi:succinyl-diaminopimelate desuccinylase